jgi:hypothetical protein
MLGARDVGDPDGSADGLAEGCAEGIALGATVGPGVARVGRAEGADVVTILHSPHRTRHSSGNMAQEPGLAQESRMLLL